MIILELRDLLKQALLTYFLSQHGFETTLSQQCQTDFQETLPVIRITDDIERHCKTTTRGQLICLVDCNAMLPDYIPDHVNGLICFQSDNEDLLRCLSELRQGKRYISPYILSALINRKTTTPVPSITEKLSRREQEVFDLLKQGLSCNQIANRLFISANTVENHRANIQRKLGLSGRYSLVRYAATNV